MQRAAWKPGRRFIFMGNQPNIVNGEAMEVPSGVPAAGRLIGPTSVPRSAMEVPMENYLWARMMRAKSRNNGTRAFGHRRSMTPRMKAMLIPKWRMELIITHLYGIMELMSRGESRARASWFTLHGPAFAVQSQWRLAMEKPGGEAPGFRQTMV